MDVKLYKRHGKWYNLRCYAVHMMKERRCELLPKRLLAGLLAVLVLGTVTVFSWWGLIVAVGGACVCIFLANLIRGRA